MSKYTSQLSAEELIKYIANDYVELSHEKVHLMYHEHMQICAEWLVYNTDPMTPEERLSEMDNEF